MDDPEEKRVKRQVFLPSNLGTNTFIFDSVSFLSLLTLAVFIVRVFNRVLQSNNVQTTTSAADPSLGRSLSPEVESDRQLREETLLQPVVTSYSRSTESIRQKSINSVSVTSLVNSRLASRVTLPY